MVSFEKTHEDDYGHVDCERGDFVFDDEVENDKDRQVVEVAKAPRTDVKDVGLGVVDVTGEMTRCVE